MAFTKEEMDAIEKAMFDARAAQLEENKKQALRARKILKPRHRKFKLDNGKTIKVALSGSFGGEKDAPKK